MQPQDLARQSYKGLNDWEQIAEIKIAKSYMTHEFKALMLRAGYKNFIELGRDYGMAKKGEPFCQVMISRAASGELSKLRHTLTDFIKANPKV